MKRFVFLISSILLCILGILLWYENSRTYPVAYGVSFTPSQAVWLGLDWKETYRAILTDLRPRYIRLSSFWNEIEPKKNQFDFTDLDWMMAEARRQGTRVTLVVGMKQPRWPECHVPAWMEHASTEHVRKEQFFAYIRRVIERYRNNPALEIWQVENEPFITFHFGECHGYRSEWTADEIALVRSLDPARKILVTDSGELSSWRQAIQLGDYFGTTLYRVVITPSGWRWTYDALPAVYYRWKAELQGRDPSTMFVSELQAEPWLRGNNPKDTPIAEQEKTMNPLRLQKNIDYARHIGVPRAYLWGAEWWYLMKTKFGDERYWEMVRLLTSRPTGVE